MLRFNTYRSSRYLRSRFVEGKFLLASEGTDLELEILDLLRKETSAQFGDVAIEDAWKVEKLSDTQILIKPGDAYFKGLPFSLRSGKDHLVSGAILTVGTVPVGVTASDEANGNGKIITFNNAATTPSNLYRVVITAREELLTEVEDPFLQNSNLTESTSQKIRLIYQINLVPDSLQTETPIPYRDETSASGSVTNFPNVGGMASPNFVNQTTVTPTAAGNGELVALSLISGSEGIDGRDVEIIIRNDGSIGGGIVLPNSPASQQAFSNGKLIDSVGTIYHVNAIFNDTVSTQLVIRIDKEPDQPNPQIINTKPFTLTKRDVFVTDDVNGSPQGRIHWPIATVDFDTTDGIVHETKVIDLRNKISTVLVNQKSLNKRVNVAPLNSGNISWNSTTHVLTTAAQTKLFNGIDTADLVSATSYVLKNDSCLAFTLSYDGSTLNKGNLSITISSVSVNDATLVAVSLVGVELGNIVKDSAGSVFYITAIDDVNNIITLNATPATGAATIYKDSYQEGYVKDDNNTYILAVRYNDKVYIADLELESGETSQIGDGVSQELLAYIGATSEFDSAPAYTNNYAVTDGNSLTQSVSDNSAVVETTDQYVGKPSNLDNTPTYSSNIRGIANENLTNRIGTNTDSIGDYQEDRSGYLRSNNSITWSGTQLSFTSDIILELINTKSGTLTQHIVLTASSPISLSDGESAYVNINRTSASENLTIILSGTTPIPAQAQTNKDIFVLFRRSGSNLLIPFHKELIPSGETVVIGNNIIGANRTLSNLDSPTSINQNLLPDATANNRALGNSANRWAGTTSTVVAASEIREITGTSPTIKNDSRRLTNSSSVDVLDWSGTNLDVLTRKIVNIVDPTAAQDAATKNYVDSNSGGFDTITITVNTSLVARKTYLTNSTGGALVLTLPAPVLNTFVRVKDKLGTSSTNSITVNPNGAETIDGASSYVITSDFEAKLFVSDGTNWFIL